MLNKIMPVKDMHYLPFRETFFVYVLADCPFFNFYNKVQKAEQVWDSQHLTG